MISSPCAKLISRMIPKITAMPSAKSAYRLPSEIASMASWITRCAVTSASRPIALRSPGRRRRARVSPASSSRVPERTIAPRPHDVGAVGELDRPPHVLLDEQHRRAAAPRISASASKTSSTRIGARPERRLVEQQQPRLGDQRTGDRELLLLAARERPRRQPVGRAQDREAVEHALERGARARAVARPAVPPSARFSATVSVAKMCRPSGTRAMPRRAIVLGPRVRRARRPRYETLAAGERDEADDRCQRRRLAGAVRADETDDLALVDLEVEVLDRGRAAVADGQITNSEHRLPCRAEVGREHGRVGANLGRRAERDRLAVVEHLDALATAS